jgi:hypothetical protein
MKKYLRMLLIVYSPLTISGCAAMIQQYNDCMADPVCHANYMQQQHENAVSMARAQCIAMNNVNGVSVADCYNIH